jgi:hypothetical protein
VNSDSRPRPTAIAHTAVGLLRVRDARPWWPRSRPRRPSKGVALASSGLQRRTAELSPAVCSWSPRGTRMGTTVSGERGEHIGARLLYHTSTQPTGDEGRRRCGVWRWHELAEDNEVLSYLAEKLVCVVLQLGVGGPKAEAVPVRLLRARCSGMVDGGAEWGAPSHREGRKGGQGEV